MIGLLEAHSFIVKGGLVGRTENVISLLIVGQFEVKVLHDLVRSINLTIADRDLLVEFSLDIYQFFYLTHILSSARTLSKDFL